MALWRGWLPSVIGVVPYVGLNFCVYETLKDYVLKYHGEGPSWSILHNPSSIWSDQHNPVPLSPAAPSK